jgi:hypothetical protein
MRNSKSFSVAVGLGLLAMFAGVQAKTRSFDSPLLSVSQTAIDYGTKQQHSNVFDEESLPTDPQEREKRLARSMRYNGVGCDLMTTDDCAFEYFAPGPLSLIPLKESAIAFVGRVTKMQPYLSADRRHIYIETTLIVEELLKSPKDFALSDDRTVITDDIGGAMRLRSGRVIRDGSKIENFRDQPYDGGRYVLFVKKVHEGLDLEILRAYELRDGKVFKLAEDGSPGNVVLSNTPNNLDSLSDEQTLLQSIRKRAHQE